MSVVTDDLLERFAREYYANSPRCPYDPETARTAPMDVAHLRNTEDGAAMLAALAAVAPIIAAAERERCARVCDAFPARTHGALATAPYAAAEQAADEIAAAIRALGGLSGDHAGK